MPDLTFIIPGNTDLVSSANPQSIIAVKKLANDIAPYLHFYWLRHDIECDINLSEFPVSIELKFTKLSPEKKLNDYQLKKFNDLQSVFTEYPQESTFYVERSEGEIEHRINETKRFFEILLNLLKYQESDYSTLFNKFVSAVGEDKIKSKLFAPTPVAKSSTVTEYFRQGLTKAVSITGLAYLCTLERIFNIFQHETQLADDKRDYFNTIISPINNNQFFAGRIITMPENNNNTTVKLPTSESAVLASSGDQISSSATPSPISNVDTQPEVAKSFMTKTKERLSNLLSFNPVHLSMPGLSTCLAVTSVATLTAAGFYAYRSGYRPEGLFNLFKRSDASSNSAQTILEVAKTVKEASKPVVNAAAETAKEVAKPVVKAIVPRLACR